MRKSMIRWAAVAVVALAGVIGARGDVIVYGEAEPVSTLILGIVVEDPDPVGPAMGEPAIPPGVPGKLHGEGGPVDVVFAVGSAAPLVVWAAAVEGFDHDIAFVEWTGSDWSPVVYLTWGGEDDLDPRIFREPDGTVHVVWWSFAEMVGSMRVFVSSRPLGGEWSLPEQVSELGESAHRPSVAAVGAELWIAYERDSAVPGMSQDLVVARRDAGGEWTRETVASTARTGRLDPMLHVRADRVWLDWKHGGSELAYTEHDGIAWAEVEPEPWVTPTWVGVEEVRRVLEPDVLP